MGYEQSVLRRATARLEGERRAREERQQALRRAACQRQPRLSEIDRQLRGTMTELFAASLRRGEGGAPTVEEVRRKNLALQQERAELLGLIDGYLRTHSVPEGGVEHWEYVLMAYRADEE